MRFFVNDLNIQLFLPVSIKTFHESVGVLVPSTDINNFIQGNTNLYSVIFKQLYEFECKNSTIMNDWIQHMLQYTNNTNYNITNRREISQELIDLYRIELESRESKIPHLIYQLNYMLNYYDRLQFTTGDMLEYTTTISYKDNTIPSKIYRHRIIIS